MIETGVEGIYREGRRRGLVRRGSRGKLYTPDDLNSGTPSVQRMRPVCSATEKNFPGPESFLYLCPS